MSRFMRERLKSFDSYTPGEQLNDKKYIKLNTNESPYPPAPEVIDALTKEDIMSLRLYPDPTGKSLKSKLAEYHNTGIDNIFLTNGSDDVLNFAFMAFCDTNEETVFADITYSFYKVIAELNNVNYSLIPLEDDFSLNYKKYLGINKNIFIANPNAPTGMVIPLWQIEEIVKSNPNNIVLIDEAYIDFGGESAIPLTQKYENIIVSRTYSKSKCFAGGRLGYAVAHKALIDDLKTIQYSTNPYNVDALTLKLGEAALSNDKYYKDIAQKIKNTRAYTVKALRELGFYVLESHANFVFARHRKISGETVYKRLRDEGVLVRHFTAPKIKDFNRISIGTDCDMQTMVNLLKQIVLSEENQ